jgi:putative FmdB family regulatory protein
MPLYDFECDIFGHRFERMVKLAQFHETQTCSCGSPATRLLSAPMFHVENVYYDCPITGEGIVSMREHQANLDRHGCRVWEPGETDAIERRKQEADATFERQLDETVDRQFEALSSDQKERLTNEVLGGMDVKYERAGS